MSRKKSGVKDFSYPLYLALGRLLWERRALASALTYLILALVILIRSPEFLPFLLELG